MRVSPFLLLVRVLLVTSTTSAFAIQQVKNRSTRRISTQLQSNLFPRATLTEIPSVRPVNHRHAAKDWLHNVITLPRSTVLRDIGNPVLTITFWSMIVSLLHKTLASSALSSLRKMASNMCVSSTPHSFMVSSIGLLLVFRTNSAYQRFAEGRQIWEQILSISRNLTRMLSLYENDIGYDKVNRIRHVLAAFPYLLRHHIRPRCLQCEKVPKEHRLCLTEYSYETVDTRHDGDKTHGGTVHPEAFNQAKPRECWVDRRHFPWSLFPKATLRKVAEAKNRPLWACDRIGKEISFIPYGPNYTSRERLAMIGQVDKLCNAVGECERIHQTAVPLNYARHSLRCLTLWLFTLPFAMVKDFGLLTGPVMGATAWLLFGIYQIGYNIEDPFQGSLRLSVLCDSIRRDVLADNTARNTAFSLDDNWANEDWSEVADGSKLGRKNLKIEDDAIVTLPKRVQDDNNLILNSPSLTLQNGSWNMLGVAP